MLQSCRGSRIRFATFGAPTGLGLTFSSSLNDGSAAPVDCGGLDPQVSEQATLRVYAKATMALRERAEQPKAKFLAMCNAISAELDLDASKVTASEACGILKTRIDSAVHGAAQVQSSTDFNCRATLTVQTQCEGRCQVVAVCDVKANCKGGDVVVLCTGPCSGRPRNPKSAQRVQPSSCDITSQRRTTLVAAKSLGPRVAHVIVRLLGTRASLPRLRCCSTFIAVQTETSDEPVT